MNLLIATAHSSALQRQSIRRNLMCLPRTRTRTARLLEKRMQLREGAKCHPSCRRRLCKARQKFLLNLLFSLDSKAKEIYTLVSCIAASMVNIDWERRQTQPRQSNKQRQHTRGTPKRVPRGVFSLVFMRLFAHSQNSSHRSILEHDDAQTLDRRHLHGH
jgi:hypothetical protein